MSFLSQGDGVLLVGHGTRDALGTRQFFALASLLAQRLAPTPVQPCLLELQPPTINDGWKMLADQQVTHVHAAPLLLFSAGHAKSDIPDALTRCQGLPNQSVTIRSPSDRPTITWSQSRPLSRAPELLRLVQRRLAESISILNTSPSTTAIVMVGRGSYDPCAQADMKLLSHWVCGQGFASSVSTAFYAMAHPRLPVVLQRVAAQRHIDSIVVQPHLLFAGALYDAIIQQVDDASKAYPNKRFVVSRYLGPESEIVDAIVRRLGQHTVLTIDESISHAPRVPAHLNLLT